MNKNQNGFANLEIILILGIIAIFSTVAVPKMARILDKVALNYELKHIYSELNLARSLGKSSTYNGWAFPDSKSQQKVQLRLYGKYYNSDALKNVYQIRRPSAPSASAHYFHRLTNGITLDFSGGDKVLSIEFDNPGRYSSGSKTLTLTSKYEDSAQIVFDTVGRWRGKYVK